MQDPKNKSQSISVTAFQSVAANEGLSPAPSFSAGRLPSMDAEMAQAIQLSLAGQCCLCTLPLIHLLASFIGCGLALGLTCKVCTLYGDFAVHAAQRAQRNVAMYPNACMQWHYGHELLCSCKVHSYL